MEVFYQNYVISDDRSRMRVDQVYKLLSSTYWAKNRTVEAIERSMENSLCFGVYLGQRMVGFARCVTDYAVMYWLGDVVIEEEYRGQGLGKALMQAVTGHEALASLYGVLETRDAHGLYERYGYIRNPDNAMCKP